MNAPGVGKRLSGFVLDKEKIVRFKDMPPAAKLEWLEEANRFVRLALDETKLRIWEKFRRGEI
ncbi:MAG: hypothetical protein WCP22_09550 [Chlamydiota bacterium]